MKPPWSFGANQSALDKWEEQAKTQVSGFVADWMTRSSGSSGTSVYGESPAIMARVRYPQSTLALIKSGRNKLERQGYQDTTTYICTDFANVSAAGAYDMLNVGIYVRADSNNAGNSMGISNAGIADRWIY